MRRTVPRRDLGEAISIEDALALLTVIFVLFILFLVPLVNIDRLRLEEAKQDPYWEKLSRWLDARGSTDTTTAYDAAFGLDGNRVHIGPGPEGGVIYVESLDRSGALTVVEHSPGEGRFHALSVQTANTVPSYRFGSLRWSAVERVWFVTSDSLDYGDRPESAAMRARYREFTKSRRGF